MGTLLLLFVLAGWIGVGFWWFTSHRDAPTDAIGSFRRQLGTLERRTPGAMAPAHRLGAVGTRAGSPGLRRSVVQKRRRDILSSLALLTASTFALGFVPVLRLLWVAAVVSAGLLAAYVYMLVQLRNLAAEREMRDRFGSRPARRVAPVRSAVVRHEAAYEDDLAYAYGYRHG